MTKKIGNKHYTRPIDNNKKNKENVDWTKSLGKYLDLVYRTLFIIGIFSIIGWFLDDKFKTMPYFLLLFIFLGTGLGFYFMINSMNELNKK